jgi:uncharacterized protein (TIGR03084 family)
MPTIDELGVDLAAEHASLDAVVSVLDEPGWSTDTPASGWDVRDTISHLTYFDEQATLAIDDPAAFEEHKAGLIAAMAAGDSPDIAIGRTLMSAGGGPALLQRWRASRNALIARARRAAQDAGGTPPRVAWYGPPMSLASFVTARVMETWAHGVDIRDALGAPLQAACTERLRHVCHIAYGTRSFAFAVHGVEDPGDPVAMVVDAPGGEVWTWGPPADETTDVITGSALDVALVFTQRRHPSRTGITAKGATAQRWLSVAQAFAGPPSITAEGR